MREKILFKKSFSVFRKWSSKGYSVFNSLKREVVIGSLMIAYLLFADVSAAQTQDDSTKVAKSYDLETIDVNSDELPEAYSEISRVVITITKSEIERASVSNLNELLEYATNVDIRQRGTNGIQADISIRGGSFDQVLVLLNGVNITDPQTGHHNLNLPIDLAVIQKVEVLKGPGAWKFGPGAFSGAINIVTKVENDPFLNVSVEAGQYGYNTEKISGTFGLKKTAHLFSVNRSSSEGYISNTDYNFKNVFYQGVLNTESSKFSLQAGATDKGFGANSFYTAMYPNQYEEVQTYFTSLDAKIQLKKLQLAPKAYYRRNNDRFVLFRENPASWYTLDNFHTSDVYGVNLLTNYIHGTFGTTTIGVDSRTELIRSNKLGEETNQTIYSPVNDTILLNRRHSRTNFSIFAGHKHYFNRLMVNLGVNLTHNTDLKSQWFLYPGIDMNYDFNENSSLFGSVNKTMRMPTYTDLYYSGPSNEGNPNLLPESAMGFELGYNFQNTFLKSSFTAFYMLGENMIDWVKEPEAAKWKTINYTELNTLGFELSVKANFEELFGDQQFLKSAKFNYTNMYQNKLNSDWVSNYSLNYLKHRVDFSIVHNLWKNLGASWQFAFQDRNGQFEKIVDKTSLGFVDYDPFITADVKVYWQKNNWNIYTSINNIFGVEYYDFGNVPQPGRWIKMGISKRIDF